MHPSVENVFNVHPKKYCWYVLRFDIASNRKPSTRPFIHAYILMLSIFEAFVIKSMYEWKNKNDTFKNVDFSLSQFYRQKQALLLKN